MSFTVVALVLALLACLARVYLPGVGPPPGEIIRREAAPLLARLRLHAAPVGAVLLLAGAAVVSGRASLASGLLVLAGAALLVGLPVRYTITSEGIRLGQTRFRRWTEFGGVARRPGGARLQGVSGARGLTVWLAGSRDADETILLLRRMVRDAYKGETGAVTGVASAGQPNVALDVARAAS